MNFQSVLREIVDHCDGGIAAALMQSDGIPVAEVTVDPASLTEEIATAGAEFGRILEELRKASDAVGGGEDVIAHQFVLLFKLPGHRFRASHQGQAIG